ncbi:MAG: hypothetical protein H7124_07900 [Phycisphaerales bacterium]|nr:hypothetical protein [Hyphomonadaceae bacterium]
MTVDELRAGSTYPFGADPSAGSGNIGSYQITTPYNLVFHNGEREIALENLGMEHQSAFIVVTEGRVTNFTLPAQRELLTLDDAIDRARGLSEQLKDTGFGGDRAHFYPQNMRRGVPRPNISNLEEARAALADPALMIAEMSLFVGETPDLSASLIISSGPRMLELQSIPGQPENPVSAAIREARRGREWTLQLDIGPNVFGPTPLVMPD